MPYLNRRCLATDISPGDSAGISSIHLPDCTISLTASGVSVLTSSFGAFLSSLDVIRVFSPLSLILGSVCNDQAFAFSVEYTCFSKKTASLHQPSSHTPLSTGSVL